MEGVAYEPGTDRISVGGTIIRTRDLRPYGWPETMEFGDAILAAGEQQHQQEWARIGDDQLAGDGSDPW